MEQRGVGDVQNALPLASALVLFIRSRLGTSERSHCDPELTQMEFGVKCQSQAGQSKYQTAAIKNPKTQNKYVVH